MEKKRKLEDILEQYLPQDHLGEVNRILYGTNHNDRYCVHLQSESREDFDIEMYRFNSDSADESVPRIVRIAAIQHSVRCPVGEPVMAQRQAMFEKISKMIQSAAEYNVNILCLPETWNMPFGFGTREIFPYCEFAEDAETGPTTMFLKNLALQNNMIIISPILERNVNEGDLLWNTAVVISENGHILGKQRKNHIPTNGECGYYLHGNNGHPVFDTTFGKIGISICYDRHQPQNWLMYALNGAEIVFNTCATTINEHWWPIESRSAAVANNYYTVALNRVGTESYKDNSRATGMVVRDYFGSSFVSAPNGSRTKSLPSDREGILCVELDLNLCKRDIPFGFTTSQRPQYYKYYFNKWIDGTYESLKKIPI